MDIAVLGGTFNPPHKGHVAVVRLLLRHADEVWIMVANRPNKTAPDLCPAKDRLSMARKAFRMERVRVRDDEIRKKGISYTADTWVALEKKYPQHRFVWVIGSDLVPQVSAWKNSATLLKKPFWIVFRPYIPIDEKSLAPFSKTRILRGKGFEISSTTLREDFKKESASKAIRFLPRGVWRFIRQKRLYGIAIRSMKGTKEKKDPV